MYPDEEFIATLSGYNTDDPASMDQFRKKMLALLDEMRQTNKALLKMGIDPRDTEDREAMDVLQRIERRVKRKNKSQKVSTKG